MGNSNGTLAEYWDAIESTPGLQGGFIWEFWDHGLVQTLPDGRDALGLRRRLRRRSRTTATSVRRAGLAGPPAEARDVGAQAARGAGPDRRRGRGPGGGRVEIANRQHFRDLGWLRAR